MDPFDFVLPPDRIAQTPARPRDEARLLHVASHLADRRVLDLPTLLRDGDVLVVNDTEVIPAQLEARRGAARIGLTLDQPQPDGTPYGTWHALARNARRLRPGDQLTFPRDPALRATILERDADTVTLRFSGPFEAAADLALPPYIARGAGPTAADAADYQTVFAARPGAVAAPTAGLHFTPRLLAALPVPLVRVTLHVGAGTFLPVRVADPAAHRMHAERAELGPEAADAINRARRVVAVGTTSVRLVETAAAEDGTVRPFAGETRLFITPGYRFRRVGAILTNFHLPRSTLFMLVCAFAGTDRMRAAYAHAIASGYRFYSYGDATFLEPA